MRHLSRIINKTLSVRLSLVIVSAMALLLVASMVVMLHYSRKGVKEEALQKASQTLESTVERIDNILLSVEQTTGNFYFSLQGHLDQPDQVDVFCRQLVESNPIVEGCAIAFKPNYFPQHEYYMAYYHRVVNRDMDTVIVQSESFANALYAEQKWFTIPMETLTPRWLNPLMDIPPEAGIAPLVTFCLPLPGADGHAIGVIGVDVSLSQLSQVIAQAKPSENSYSVLLDKEGSFIVSPVGDVEIPKSALALAEGTDDSSVKEAIRSMTSGETGYQAFTLQSKDYYVFFMPFKRTVIRGRYIEDLGWSVGIIFPEDDIFGDYNNLRYYVLGIAVVSLLLLFLLCRAIIHHQIMPLRMLAEKAQRIAKGSYNEPIPDSRQEDEVGRLQDNFQQMQQSLAKHIGELEQLTARLQQDGEHLRIAYQQAQQANRVKTDFLHNMTDQMTGPAECICETVSRMSGHEAGKQETDQLVDAILQNGNTIANLLDDLINVSVGRIRKEADDD